MSKEAVSVKYNEYDKKTLLLEEKGISKEEWEDFVEDFKDDEELPDKIASQMKRAAKTKGSERTRSGLKMNGNKCEGAFVQRLSVENDGKELTYQLAFYSVAFAFEDEAKRLTSTDLEHLQQNTRINADIFFQKEAEHKLISADGTDHEESEQK